MSDTHEAGRVSDRASRPGRDLTARWSRHTLKRAVKSVAYKLFPQLATELFSARARAHSQRLAHEWGCTALNQKLLTVIGDRVIDGPFRGIALSPMTAAEHLGPYLLGVYVLWNILQPNLTP